MVASVRHCRVFEQFARAQADHALTIRPSISYVKKGTDPIRGRSPFSGYVPVVRKQEPPRSRVLSWTTIHLGRLSPVASSNLPGSPLRRAVQDLSLRTPLFGLAPGGVCRAAACHHPRGALLPHLFTLTGAPSQRPVALRRFVFCGTFHGLSPSRRYLAPCPMEPGLSSAALKSATAVVWPTLTFSSRLLYRPSYRWKVHLKFQVAFRGSSHATSIGGALFAGRVPHFPGRYHREDFEEKKKRQQKSGGKADNQYQLG